MTLSGPLHGAGLLELSWRDPVANIQIEKRQLALVPRDARIAGTMTNALNGEIRLNGLPGWTASVREIACTGDATDVRCFDSVRRTPSLSAADDAAAAGGTVLRCDCSACRPRRRGAHWQTARSSHPADRSTSARCAARSPWRPARLSFISPRRAPSRVGSGCSLMANFRLESCGARSMRRSRRCPARMIWWNSISSAIRGRRSASAAIATISLRATARCCAGADSVLPASRRLRE